MKKQHPPRLNLSPFYKNADFTYILPLRTGGLSSSAVNSPDADSENSPIALLLWILQNAHSPKLSSIETGAFYIALETWDSWDGTVEITTSEGKGPFSARGLVAKCYNGRYISITLRFTDAERAKFSENPELMDYLPQPRINIYESLQIDKFAPDSSREPKHASSLATIVSAIYDRLSDDSNANTGLLVLSGSTNCCKSALARGLIAKFLNYHYRHRNNRRPHLITLEDPIEFQGWNGAEEPRNRCCIDYTPRELRPRHGESFGDCRSLEAGLRDALRNNPAAFFVGETRDKEDWKHILKFAGSGHLVITTTHAGSLTETFKSMLDALEAKTPADRRGLASKILGIVHVRNVLLELDAWHMRTGDIPKEKENPNQKIAVLPQLWRGTANSVAAFVGDGLASIVPSRPSKSGDHTSEPFCLSRVGFVRTALKEWELTEDQLVLLERQVLKAEIAAL